MEIKLVQLLIAGSVVMFISCNSVDNSVLEETVNELQETQNNMQEQIVAIKALQDNQEVILKKIQTIDKSIANLTLANKNRPTDNKKKQPPKADPNKVYSVKIGNSFFQGNKNAKVTIIEWSDYF